MSFYVGMPIQVTMRDGTVHDTLASPLGIHETEELQKASIYELLGKGQKASDTYLLAWQCLRADGVKVKPFKQWLAEVQQVTIDWNWLDPKVEGQP